MTTTSIDVPTAPRSIAFAGLCLVVLGPAAERIPLPKGEVIIGRAGTCDIQLDDPSLSRRHAALTVESDRITLRDLGSSNGTRVRGVSVGGEPVAIGVDELIRVGGVSLVIERIASTSPRIARGTTAPPTSTTSPMERVRALLERVAAGTISVLILGETGVGKEVLAEAVHRASPRAAQPFVRLNCAALSETLLESELFGYEKGAFTGADRTKPGLLETAHGGTVFLDEIGELPMATQVKLLRVIEQREVTRVGGLAPRPIDVRFVAATHRDLVQEIEAGRFRQDLYFRLNGISLVIPPLRERLCELDALARGFLERSAKSLGYSVPALTKAARDLLLAHPWPGNIRELRNVIERAVLLAGGKDLEPEHVVLEMPVARGSSPHVVRDGSPQIANPPRVAPAHTQTPPLAIAPDGDLAQLRRDVAAIERERIVAALTQAAGNQKAAAALLGVSRRTLINKLDAYRIARPRKLGAA